MDDASQFVYVTPNDDTAVVGSAEPDALVDATAAIVLQ